MKTNNEVYKLYHKINFRHRGGGLASSLIVTFPNGGVAS